jgi:predicted transcriptional regulator
MKLYVLDQFMGSGKTISAINYINDNLDKTKFLVVTKFLSEINRFKTECSGANFVAPEKWRDEDTGRTISKSERLKHILYNNENIICSHECMANIAGDEKVIEALQYQNRVLIIDEIVDAIEVISITNDIINMLIEQGCILINPETNKVELIQKKEFDLPDEEHKPYKELFDNIKSGIVYSYQDGKDPKKQRKFLIWTYPIELFKEFNKVILLTYGYKYQLQYKLFSMYGIETIYVDNLKSFNQIDEPVLSGIKFKDYINVYNGKYNDIGGGTEGSLSYSWYKENTTERYIVKNNIYNLHKNKWKAYQYKLTIPNDKEIGEQIELSNIIWTCFKKDYPALLYSNAGLENSYVQSRSRSTSSYQGITNVVYPINIHYKPVIVKWLSSKGISITKQDQNNYALIECLQWIFRSAIRTQPDPIPINLYIPSKRMRSLLLKWLGYSDEQLF